MAEPKENKYWLNIVASEIIKLVPSGEIVLQSGISPSGAYHIGHFREVITTDAVKYALEKSGRKVRHIHFVDDSDPLRKVYPFLPKNFGKYVGQPYWKIVDPEGNCHKNYAEHYFSEFQEAVKAAGVEMEIKRSHKVYMAGNFDGQLEAAITKTDKVRKILEAVSDRKLPSDWTGVQVFESKISKFRNIKTDEWKNVKNLVPKGLVKLSWRLDWPARWALNKVNVEPFGKEHATKGGSYDTGRRIVKEIFGAEAPYPIPYDTINLAGETKKMSSSLGNLVTLSDALKIIPAEILRYFIVKSRPKKQIFFDTGNGLFSLIDEFSRVEGDAGHEFKDAYEYAVSISKNKRTISSVPFKHLISVYQTAASNDKRSLEILKNTGYQKSVKTEAEILKREFEFVKNWLHSYAPEEVKFDLQEKLPKLDLSKDQRAFLEGLSERVAGMPTLEAQAIHEEIYNLAKQYTLKPQDAFKAIYQVLIGKDFGPRAGWFLASLDKSWLIKRLKETG